MNTYIVKADMNLGEQSNDIGIRTPVTVTKGQSVTGDVTMQFILNANTQGVEYKAPSKIMGTGKPAGGMDTFFIPLSNLDLQGSTSPDKTFLYIGLGVAGIIVTLGVLKLLKVI
jgi:hypothetical protein